MCSAVRAISAEVSQDLINSSVGWTVNTAGYIVGRHMADSFQDPTLAFPVLQGPQHRTTLVKGDNGKWQILELNEPLRLLVSLDAKFHDLQGNRSTITLVTPGEKDPAMMGFKFEEDGPMELQAKHHEDDGENVLLATEDDVQDVGDVAQPDDVAGQELGGGRIVVQPQRDDQIEVNGETLTAESSLANLRAACRTYGISTSGSKIKVFRKLVEHQKVLQMESGWTAQFSIIWQSRGSKTLHHSDTRDRKWETHSNIHHQADSY